MSGDDPKTRARAWRLALFVLGGTAGGMLLGAIGLVRDLGPGPDACSGGVCGFLLGAAVFALEDRRRG
jgi:hypothetical protein